MVDGRIATVPVHARELTGEQHTAAFARFVQVAPAFAQYQAKAPRLLPVVRFEPRQPPIRRVLPRQANMPV